KAQIHLVLNEHAAAQAALKRVSKTGAVSQESRVSRARTHMATAETLIAQRRVSALPAAVSGVLRSRAVRHYRAGLSSLATVVSASGLETTYPRQAQYLSGLCAQRIAEMESRPGSLPNYDSAINYFGHTARDFPGTHEAVAASLRAAELLRIAGRSEEALKSFRSALQSGSRGGGGHNRWISRTEFRKFLFRAWNEWMEQGAFASAIELSGMMSPIVPEVRAQELHAIANMEWARKLERDLPNSPSSQQKAFAKRLLLRRQATGQSYARLAQLVKTTSRYSDSLWTSAVNFHAGHDFENALKQYTEFINTHPKKRLAQSLVRRGRVLMDLDRLKEARDHFQQVRDTFRENPARFEALYLLGTCHLEMGEDDVAESIWRGILASPDLTPAASEWRLSLFSLGRHQFHKAKILKEQADQARDRDPKQSHALRDRAANLWRESIRRLEEHEERYPKTWETVSARFLIAKAAQELAGALREKLDEAEVENVRNEYRRRMNQHLKQAETRFRQLQTQLLREEEAKRLNELGRSYLRDCYYEIAHTLYALERFEAAIPAYTNAANRYPHDPQVLLAYLQMANCNDRLGDASEALSLILQAEVILKQLPDDVFTPDSTGMTKQEWKKWLTWAKQLRKDRPTSATPPRLLPQ
ncbi:MAG: tetratricopeptide repeat protein, partial [Planctomycetaceae bacterium]